MRKHYLFIAVAALFLFTACGDDTTAKPDNSALPDETVTDTAAPRGTGPPNPPPPHIPN